MSIAMLPHKQYPDMHRSGKHKHHQGSRNKPEKAHRLSKSDSALDQFVRSSKGDVLDMNGSVMSTTSVTNRAAFDAERIKNLEKMLYYYKDGISRETLKNEGMSRELESQRSAINQILEPKEGVPRKEREDRAAMQSISSADIKGMQNHIELIEKKFGTITSKKNLLMKEIDDLRKQARPHHQARQDLKVKEKQMLMDMQMNKMNAINSLNERDKVKDATRHLLDDNEKEKNNFMHEMNTLRDQINDSVAASKNIQDTHDNLVEERKRHQYILWADRRLHEEKKVQRYGYLQNQLRGLNSEFEKLEKIVHVKFEPEDPGTVDMIVSKHKEKDGQNQSLHRFWVTQTEAHEQLERELEELEEESGVNSDTGGVGGKSPQGDDAEELVGGMAKVAKESKITESYLATSCLLYGELTQKLAATPASAGVDLEVELLEDGCNPNNVQSYLELVDTIMENMWIRSGMIPKIKDYRPPSASSNRATSKGGPGAETRHSRPTSADSAGDTEAKKDLLSPKQQLLRNWIDQQPTTPRNKKINFSRSELPSMEPEKQE